MKTSKKTLVIGASENPERYSFKAVTDLKYYGHPILAIGRRAGKIQDVEISKELIAVNDIDTVTLYLNPENQKPFYDYILSLKPKRIIFNPGTENSQLEKLAEGAGIETIEACTLVMLRTGQF